MVKNRIILDLEQKTTKIFLASMEDSHIKHLIKLARDPSLINLVGWDTFFALDDTQGFIEAISSYAFPYSRKSQSIVFGIYLNFEDLPIGYVVLKGLNMELLTAEIGIAILDRKHWHQGYGTLAMKRFIRYSFEDLNIQTIGAVILSSNKISINMFTTLGFIIKEVQYKSWLMPNGDFVDMVLMELNKTQ